jgi:sulfite exporter TauE/SafE
MLLEGFLLGLSTGTYCAAACFPVAVPFVLAEDAGGAAGNARRVGLFLLGRLAAYVLFGFMVGAAGRWAAGASGPGLAPAALAWAYVVLGLLMIVSGAAISFPGLKICALYRRAFKPGGSALVFGFLTGLNVCPPFLAAGARVFGQAGGLGGALYFLAFCAGTAIYFLPLLGAAWLQKYLESIRLIGRAAMMFVGAYFLVVLGILGLI